MLSAVQCMANLDALFVCVRVFPPLVVPFMHARPTLTGEPAEEGNFVGKPLWLASLMIDAAVIVYDRYA